MLSTASLERPEQLARLATKELAEVSGLSGLWLGQTSRTATYVGQPSRMLLFPLRDSRK